MSRVYSLDELAAIGRRMKGVGRKMRGQCALCHGKEPGQRDELAEELQRVKATSAEL